MKNVYIAKAGFLVTPSDSADLAADAANTELVRNCVLHVGVGGTLKVTTEGGSTLTLTVGSGFLPISVRRVYATGTSATPITALYDDVVL
jgi:hypothetical protein